MIFIEGLADRISSQTARELKDLCGGGLPAATVGCGGTDGALRRVATTTCRRYNCDGSNEILVEV